MSSALASGLYEGTVRHHRHAPRDHRFALRVAIPYVDLDELPRLFEGFALGSARRRNLMWFRRKDYLAPHDLPLAEAVRQRVEQATGVRPEGPVRMLAHVRTLGWCFNPVAFYWCFDEADRPQFVLAEITNTPWRERHAHVLDLRDAQGPGATTRHDFDKVFHVSPFLPMDLHYTWSFRGPGDRLGVHMECRRSGEVVLEATMALQRRSWSPATLRRLLVRHLGMTWRISAMIYLQALRLALKRVPFHPHPRRARIKEASA